MSSINEIRRQLNTANARIASLEKALNNHRGYPSIAANLESALRVRERLEAQLREAAAETGIELPNLDHVVPPGTPAS